MSSPEPGLRERKRLATRRAIQSAALRVVRERGLDGATIDEISRVADVSPRTFFNYFSSKEDAILGETPTLEGTADADAFVADRGPLLPGMVRLIVDASAGLMVDPELLKERRAVTKLHPELIARRTVNLHRIEAELAAIVERRLEAEHPGSASAQTRDRARLVAFVAMAFARHAWFAWLENTDSSLTLPELIDRAFALGEELVVSSYLPPHRATETMR